MNCTEQWLKNSYKMLYGVGNNLPRHHLLVSLFLLECPEMLRDFAFGYGYTRLWQRGEASEASRGHA
jgi:hypothetical protein